MTTTTELAHRALAAASASPGGDQMTALDEAAGVLHDADCTGGYCRARRACWAWNAGRYHRAVRTLTTTNNEHLEAAA